MVQVIVICASCRHAWRSQASSGRTRCAACGERAYIPAAVRRRVEDAPGRYRYDSRTGRLSIR